MNWLTNDWISPTGLAKDPPLTAFGLEQATEVANYFLNLPEDTRPSVILSSPYYRCLQTSEPTAASLNLPIYVEHGLSEWYSPVAPNTGLHPRPGSAAELKSCVSAVDRSWSTVYYPPRKGENVAEVHQRCVVVLDALIRKIEKETSHSRVVLVSHAATVIALTRALLRNPSLPMRVGCCTITTLKRDSSMIHSDPLGGWVYRFDELATGKHLREGIQRDWGFEDIEIANGDVINDTGIPGTEYEIDNHSGLQTQYSLKDENFSRL